MFGAKTGSMKGTGNIIKCMATVKYNGLMGENIRVSIVMIRKKDKAHSIGQMVENILGDGRMENNMAKLNIICKMVIKK